MMRSNLVRFFTFDFQSVPFSKPVSIGLRFPVTNPVATATTLFSKPHHHLSEGTSMIGNYFCPADGSSEICRAGWCRASCSPAGCANMSSVAPTGTNPFSSPATLRGTIHGGNQPVIGATVTLCPLVRVPLPSRRPPQRLGSGLQLHQRLGPGGHDGTTSTYSLLSHHRRTHWFISSLKGQTRRTMEGRRTTMPRHSSRSMVVAPLNRKQLCLHE